MSENNNNTYKNVFNDLILSYKVRSTFFERAYKYISQSENISISDQNSGMLAFIGSVKTSDSDDFDYVFKIGDYLKTIASGNVSGETLPMLEIKDYDMLTKKEIEFLLKVQGKEFEDVEYRKVLWINKQDRPEGAENIIEIKGYGKIPQEELIRQYTDKGEVVSTEGFQVPFRFLKCLI